MILVVDDDRTVRESLEFMLRVARYECICASDADTALHYIREHADIDLAILDMNLHLGTTGRDGIELLRKIKVLRPELPVILISAWGNIPLVVEGMQYGAVDFVAKPWSNADFVSKIKHHLEKKSITQKVPTLEQVEQDAILSALKAADGNLTQAAATLGITRQSLYRRIQKFGL